MPAVWPEKLQQEWSSSSQPDAKRPRRASIDFGLSLTSTISVETTWTASDIAKAGGLLTIPPRPVPFEDEEEMRRVYSLIYDVFRYKSVLQQALWDAAFFVTYPQFQKQPNLVWLLFYDLYKRRFLPRDHHDEEVRVHLFEESGLLEADVLLWSSRVKLAASVARLRIKNNALKLSQLLPPHLRDERVIALDEAAVTGWINTFKIEVEEVKRLVEKAGLAPLDPNLQKMDVYGYEFDHVCPKFIKFHPSQRSDLAQSTLVKRHHIILQDRAFCLGPSMICNILIELDLAGNVVQTHINSPRTMAYLANILIDNENIDNLIAFGAGERKEEYEEYLRELGVTNTEVHAEKFVDISSESEILENVVAVLATPPNTYSGVIDPVDLVCSRGGDLSMLEVLTATEIGGGSLERVNNIMEEQRQTLRISMSRPQIQIVLYETHSIVSAENSEMVTRLVNEMNNGAREKHAEEQGKPLMSASFISTSSRREGSDIGLAVGGDTTVPSISSIISVEMVDKDTKDSERATFEMDIQVPPCDLFELSALPDQSPEDGVCVTMKKEGCYLAYLRRKEIVRLNAKYMINIAESRGLFGGEGSGSKEGKKSAGRQHRKKPELQRSGSASLPLIRARTRRKVEVDRIAAPTQASILRRATDPGKRIDSLQDTSGLLKPVFVSDQDDVDIQSENTSIEQSKSVSPSYLRKGSSVGSEDSLGKRQLKRRKAKIPKDKEAILSRLMAPTKTSLNRQVSPKKVYQKQSMMSKSSKVSVTELIKNKVRSHVNVSIIDVFYGNEGIMDRGKQDGEYLIIEAIPEINRRKETVDISTSTVGLPTLTKASFQTRQIEKSQQISYIGTEIQVNQLETESIERRLIEAGRLKNRKSSSSRIVLQEKQNENLVQLPQIVSGFTADVSEEKKNADSPIVPRKVSVTASNSCTVSDPLENKKSFQSPYSQLYNQRLKFLESVREKLKLLVNKSSASSNKSTSDSKIDTSSNPSKLVTKFSATKNKFSSDTKGETRSISSKILIRGSQKLDEHQKKVTSNHSENNEFQQLMETVDSKKKVRDCHVPDAVGTKMNIQESEKIQLGSSITVNKDDAREKIAEPHTETLWETSNAQTRTPSRHDFSISTQNSYVSQLNKNRENRLEGDYNINYVHETNNTTNIIEERSHSFTVVNEHNEDDYDNKTLNDGNLNASDVSESKEPNRKRIIGDRLSKIRALTSKLDEIHERMNLRHIHAIQRINKIKKTFSREKMHDILGEAFNKIEEFTDIIIEDGNNSDKLDTEEKEDVTSVKTFKNLINITSGTRNMTKTRDGLITQNIVGNRKGEDVKKVIKSFNLKSQSQYITKGKERKFAEYLETNEKSEGIRNAASLNLTSGTEDLIKDSGGVTIQSLLKKLAERQLQDSRRERLKKLQAELQSAWSETNKENLPGTANVDMCHRKETTLQNEIKTVYISPHESNNQVTETFFNEKSFQDKNILAENEFKAKRTSFGSTKFLKTTKSGKIFFEVSLLDTAASLRMGVKQMFTPSKEKHVSKGNTSLKFGLTTSEKGSELQTQLKPKDTFMETVKSKRNYSRTSLKSNGPYHKPKEGQPISSKISPSGRLSSKSASNYRTSSFSLNERNASYNFQPDQATTRSDFDQRMRDKYSRYKRPKTASSIKLIENKNKLNFS